MDKIKDAIECSIKVKQLILEDESLLSSIQNAIDIITLSLKSGGKVLFCGNGGSAADAQHLSAELSGRFYFDRAPLSSEALHCNTSYLTAVANDYGYENVYSRIVSASANEGDVLVGLSTSGNSINVVKAFEVANKKGVKTIAMTGSKNSKMKDCATITINVPSDDTPRIQEAHITIGHIICENVEKNMFPNGK